MRERLIVAAGIAGAILFTVGAAFLMMIFEHGASGALALASRNAPILAWLAPVAVIVFVAFIVDGLSRRSGADGS